MQNVKSPSMLRHVWLEHACAALRPHFEANGYDVPITIRVSIGFPKGARGKHTIGQCWASDASSDKHAEIFVSPALGTKTASAVIVATLAHEMVHATIGHKAKHGPKFRDCALAIGLEGKMTATTPSAKMSEFAEAFIKKHGPYPAGNISALKGPTKQTTRLLKCECPECGYVVRTTAKWLEDAGAPYCGIKSHGRMGTEYESEGEE